MPILIACPTCGRRLTVPDHAAGKTVTCPKCAAPVAVPDPSAAAGFEVVGEEPRKKSGSARPARPIVGDEDAGHKRPKRKPSAGVTNPTSLIVVGAAVGGAVVLVAGILGFLFLTPRTPKPPPAVAVATPTPEPPAPPKPAPPAAPPPPAAPQWVWFNIPDVPFVAVFPNGPPAKEDPFAEVKDDRATGLLQATGLRIDRWARADGERKYTATVLRVPEALNPGGLGLEGLFSPADMLKTAEGNPLLTGGGREVAQADGTQHGFPYRHLVLQTGTGMAVVRVFGVKAAAVALRVEGRGVTADDRFAGEFVAALRPKAAGK